MPFWKGDAPGRPVELGRALGAFLREVSAAPPRQAAARARAAGLDEWGTANLLAYLAEQKEATRHVPDDRTLLVERFRDVRSNFREGMTVLEYFISTHGALERASPTPRFARPTRGTPRSLDVISLDSDRVIQEPSSVPSCRA